LEFTDEGSCGHFQMHHLFAPMNKAFALSHIISGSSFIFEEKKKLNEFIAAHGPLDVSVLSITPEGYIGFNEESAEINHTAQVAVLAPSTLSVMPKYFGDKFSPTEGITQGMGQILAAKKIILLASGEHKAAILQKALLGEIDEKIPASWLQNHDNLYVVTDRDAGAGLN